MSEKTTHSVMAVDDLLPVQERIRHFSDMLDSIDSLTDKKKTLWKEIYANAIADRNNAMICYNDLMTLVIGKPVEHAVHGPNLSKYIERMSKANDQLLKLAELIADAEEKAAEIDAEDMYSQITEG